MFPILIEFGPVKIYSFGVLATLAFLLSMALLNHQAKQAGLKVAFILDYLLSIFLVCLISGRIFHVLFKWSIYSDNLLEIIYIWQGGISLWGTAIGGILYFWYLSWRHKQDLLVWLDQIAIALQLAFILGYLAYLLSPAGLSGRSFGIPTELFWGMTLENLQSPYAGLSVHPVTIYLILGHAFSLLILYKISRLKRLAGLTTFSAGILQGVLLLITEPLKWEISYTIASYNFAIIVGISIIILGVAGLGYVFRMKRKLGSGLFLL